MEKSKRTIYFFPDYSGGNPYQKLLYQPVREIGYEVIPGNIDLAMKSGKPLSQVIFHVHWLNALFKNCTGSDEAWRVADSFITSINQLQVAGGKVMWTIHNHLPHENPFPEQDLRVRYFLASCADRIHLHCGSHIRELSYLPLNLSRVFVHRHGSYLGYYGKHSYADKVINFCDKKPKALFLGALRGYKAINSLLNLIEQLVDNQIEVTIAGKPESDEIQRKIERRFKDGCVNLILRRLTEHEVHDICSRSHIGILSYEKILTSGTLKLYLTYGLQILTPRLPTIVAEDRYGSFSYYDQASPEYKMPSADQFKEAFISSFNLAQESVWSKDLFMGL